MSGPRQHYVYAHLRSSDQVLFYIGKGKGNRAWSRANRNRQWKFVAAKHGFSVLLVKERLPEACALTLERAIIAKIGLASLVNVTEGGRGAIGYRHTDETKRKIGASQKGRLVTPKMLAAMKEANRTRVFTPEYRQKMSNARRGRSFGPHSAEVRAKISASHVGLRPSEESRRKMSLAKVGKCIGRNSPTYDHNIRTFLHASHPPFVGTRGDFIAKYQLADGCVSAVINGRQKSVKGWKVQ